jgi:hypothetical protein
MAKLCTTCGYVGNTKRVTKGSFFIELILWLAFIVPGIIYSIWRLTSRYDACPKCGGANMIPLNSPIAKRMMQEQQPLPQSHLPVLQHIPPPPPARTFTEQCYRIAKDGQDLGEFSVTVIQQMINSGQLTSHDHYFDYATNNWLEIAALADK